MVSQGKLKAPGASRTRRGIRMSFVVRLISGQQQWHERIFREKAVRLVAAFGQGFTITIDEVEDYFGETQEVFGESLRPGETLQPDDILIDICRL